MPTRPNSPAAGLHTFDRARIYALRLATAACALSVALLAAAGMIGATPASASVVCSSGACSAAFAYKGSVEEWTIPNGVSSIAFTVKGAGGGGFLFFSGHGGAGAKVSSTLSVAPATKLAFVVGGGGDEFLDGGYGGGGQGGFGFEPAPGGGGGSFVFSEAGSLLIAAGGGGGAGTESNAKGGDGGQTGTAGEAGAASGGGGATQSAGGSAGLHAEAGKGPTSTSTGLEGRGGKGAQFDEGGGGGGGGYYGGGGGGDNTHLFQSGGGGGGSSIVNGGSGTNYETGAGAAGGAPNTSGGNGEIAVSFAQPTTVTSLGASSGKPALDQPVTYTATVAPVPSGGTVAFSDGAATIAGCSSQAVSTSTGEASCTTEYSTPGAHSIKAEFSGSSDTIYPGSTSSSRQVVATVPTSTLLTPSSAAPLLGDAVTYTATVTPVPTGGTVEFMDEGNPIEGCGEQALDLGTGVAECVVSYATPGAHSITAVFSGSPDTAYEASSTASATEVLATAPESPPAPSPPPTAPAASTSTTAVSAPAPSDPQAAPSPPPALELLNDVAQPLINTRAIHARVTCGAASCTVRAEAWVRLPGMGQALQLSAGTSLVPAHGMNIVTLGVPGRVRGLVRRYLVRHRAYKVQIELTLTLMTPNASASSATATTTAAALTRKQYSLGIWTYRGLR